MPECYIRGNTIKYIRVPNEVSRKRGSGVKGTTGFVDVDGIAGGYIFSCTDSGHGA